MPLLGLGTFRLQGQEDTYNAVDAALTAGYRAFDTAAVYHNEAQLGPCPPLPAAQVWPLSRRYFYY